MFHDDQECLRLELKNRGGLVEVVTDSRAFRTIQIFCQGDEDETC